jgi:cytochrome c biogenesis protein CcmG/thiol:disulfide interchange protein DsbE
LPSTPSSSSGPRRLSRSTIVALVVVSLAVPAAVLGFALARDSDGGGTRRIIAGVDEPAPEFSLPSVDGSTVSLSDFRGTPVVLTFFASWCNPCEEELPVLERIQDEAGDRLQVLAVNYQDHIGDDSEEFVRRLGVTYPALLQPDGDPVSDEYGVHEIPQTFFIDADGVVRDRIYGQSSRAAIEPSVEALLDGDASGAFPARD